VEGRDGITSRSPSSRIMPGRSLTLWLKGERLSTILPDEPTFHGSPDAEEGLVQKVAYRILSGAPDRKLDPILSKFCAFKSKYTPNSKFEIRNSRFEIENLES